MLAQAFATIAWPATHQEKIDAFKAFLAQNPDFALALGISVDDDLQLIRSISSRAELNFLWLNMAANNHQLAVELSALHIRLWRKDLPDLLHACDDWPFTITRSRNGMPFVTPPARAPICGENRCPLIGTPGTCPAYWFTGCCPEWHSNDPNVTPLRRCKLRHLIPQNINQGVTGPIFIAEFHNGQINYVTDALLQGFEMAVNRTQMIQSWAIAYQHYYAGQRAIAQAADERIRQASLNATSVRLRQVPHIIDAAVRSATQLRRAKPRNDII